MSTTTVAPRTNPRGTKKYKGMIAAGLNDAEALTVLGRDDLIKKGVDLTKRTPTEDPIAELVAGGFTKKQAKKLLAKGDKASKGKGKGKAEMTAREVTEAMVAKRGMAFTRGRIYSNPAIIEAQVRVLKTGKPEIVNTSGAGRITAVLITREESGDCAVQNLCKPA